MILNFFSGYIPSEEGKYYYPDNLQTSPCHEVPHSPQLAWHCYPDLEFLDKEQSWYAR
jgi:hypothetical protein